MGSKTKPYPGILAALMGGVSAFLVSQLQFDVWVESPEAESFSVPSLSPSSPPLTPAQSQPVPSETILNALRVSNRTSNAVRVVLLARNPDTNQAAYLEPVHWDFAPAEGSQQGLILSLPEGNLRLEQGDILTAFALDGSSRYWGPYVVGKTAIPLKRGQPPEWHLVLQP